MNLLKEFAGIFAGRLIVDKRQTKSGIFVCQQLFLTGSYLALISVTFHLFMTGSLMSEESSAA